MSSWRVFQGLWILYFLGSLLVLAAALWRKTRVVAVALSFSMLLLPNLFRGTERGRQGMTMNGLRSVGTAIDAYAIDFQAYPTPAKAGGSRFALLVPPLKVPGTWTPLQPVGAIASFLEPTYIRSLPRRDAFGNPIYYASTGSDYVLVSGGRNGALEPWAWQCGPGSSWDDDYVFISGQFYQF